MLILNWNNIDYFYCIFDQIIAALVRIRNVFHNHFKTKLLNITVHWNGLAHYILVEDHSTWVSLRSEHDWCLLEFLFWI